MFVNSLFFRLKQLCKEKEKQALIQAAQNQKLKDNFSNRPIQSAQVIFFINYIFTHIYFTSPIQ